MSASEFMPETLQEWLDWQETLHPSEIDLGLQRVEQVLHNLIPECSIEKQSSSGDSKPFQFNQPFTVITVGGTNGKGSTVAMLEAIYAEAGYRVGSYTSPHLIHYNERIKINQVPVEDKLLCDSFQRIDDARNELSITYFEFGTLAAIDIFYHQSCDIVILEVGLGGRLDAVNIIDADLSLVTTVDIDHQAWLGSDRNSIGIEKAGIYRHNKPAIYGDTDPPQSIKDIVVQNKLSFYQYSVDYAFHLRNEHLRDEHLQNDHFQNKESIGQQWDWLVKDNLSVENNDSESLNERSFYSHYNLSFPNLNGSAQLKNASNVLMTLELLKYSCPVTQAEIKRGLQNIQLSGRFQVVSTQPFVILDVAHNVQAANMLKDSIEKLRPNGKLHVIVGMLKDKEVLDVLAVFAPVVESWRIIDLDTQRGMSANEISKLLLSKLSQLNGINIKVQCFSNFKQAYQDFSSHKIMFNSNDSLLVFGSFFTVTDALHFFNLQN